MSTENPFRQAPKNKLISMYNIYNYTNVSLWMIMRTHLTIESMTTMMTMTTTTPIFQNQCHIIQTIDCKSGEHKKTCIKVPHPRTPEFDLVSFVCTANLDTTVAFYAFNTDKPAATLSGSTIILDHAATNVGNAYDTTTGVFTAPVSGLYDFQASIMPSEPGHQSYARLLVNGRLVAIAVADTEHNQWDQSTVRAVVHVTANQQVRLEAYGYSNYYSASAEPYTTFSGYLIKADWIVFC